ncbi:MAG: DUF4255 domain-containing protein [Planctomycetes bacterium]|nr:DUF4255 domain-containing protein [Planctomycetota bacterium]
MALASSWLSDVCTSIDRTLRDELTTVFGTGESGLKDVLDFMMGPPADVGTGQRDAPVLNLFFYRIEPSGLGPDTAYDEPWYVRLHCLITIFGAPETDDNGTVTASAGEVDLRVIGEVIRVFHEKPVLGPFEVKKQKVVLQAVMQPLSLDEFNHLWANQADMPFRSSVVYEFALAPVVPRETSPGAPLVGALGVEVRADMSARHAPPTVTPVVPDFAPGPIDLEVEGWAPQICFVQGGRCAQALSFNLPGTTPTEFSVWIAGTPATSVTMHWHLWDATNGWREVSVDPSLSFETKTPAIDPSAAATAPVQSVPHATGAPAGAHQAVLFAARRYVRGRDGVEVEVRSNPLLFSVFEGGGP